MFGVDPKGDIRVEGKVGGEGKLEGDDNKNEKQKASSSSNKPSGNTASSKAHNTATATVGIPAGSGGKSLGNHENDKGHKAFVPHPHIPPPKSPPTTPLHLPPTGFTLAAHVIVITSSGRSSFSPSSPSFKYEENEEGNWLHTRDLKVGKAQVSHAPMGATGDWIRSSVAGQHGGGDLVTCLSKCEIEVTSGPGDLVRSFPPGSVILFSDYFGTGHRISSHSGPLHILTVEMKKDCVDRDCDDEVGGNETKSKPIAIIKTTKQALNVRATDVLGWTLGGTASGFLTAALMKTLPVPAMCAGLVMQFVVLGGIMGGKGAEWIEGKYVKVMDSKPGVKEAIEETRGMGLGNNEGGKGTKEMEEAEKQQQDAADREAAAAGSAM